MGAVADYLFFEPGQRKAWGSSFAERFPEQTRQAIEDAERWCKGGRIVWKNSTIDLGTPINWLYNPTGDKEFTWGINRFKHLRSLGIAYACTGDEKYAAKALEHILGWIQTQPCPHGLSAEELTYFQRPGPWRLLEVGLRLRQWVYAYHFFDGSESWTEEGKRQFFASVKEHGNFLATYKASIEINHSIMHMIGLLSAALTFASWEESAGWANTAIRRLEECIEVQVLPDGVHTELTPHYHMVSLELFVDCAVMLRKRSLIFSDRYEEILSGMARFAYSMKRQDGSMAPFADSFANQPPDLNAAALYYDRHELMLRDQLHEQMWTVGPDRIDALTNAADAAVMAEHGGDSGRSPQAELPFSFPHAGYYGLGGGGQQMIFDAAALGGPHGHADALSFELCAFGETLFVDPGTYTYMENPWRRYFKSTAAHNTVLVDGQDQTPYLRTQRWGLPEAAAHLIKWDPEHNMVCAEHDGYSSRGVVHRRAVWFLDSGEWVILDQLAAEPGGAEHVYQHRLHARLLDWETRTIDVDGASRSNGKAAGYYADGSGLDNGLSGKTPSLRCEMLLFGPQGMELDVEDSWESVHPMTMTPLKVVQGLVTSTEGAWFATVLKPLADGVKPAANAGEMAFRADAAGVEERPKQQEIGLPFSQWQVSLDGANRPSLTLTRDDRVQHFTIPDKQD